MRNLLLLLAVGFAGGMYVANDQRNKRVKLRALRRNAIDNHMDETLDHSFPASDVPSWTPPSQRFA